LVTLRLFGGRYGEIPRINRAHHSQRVVGTQSPKTLELSLTFNARKTASGRQTSFTRVSDYPKQLRMGLGGPRRVFAAVQEDFMQFNLVARLGVSARADAPYCGDEVVDGVSRETASAFDFLSSTQDIHSGF
jgi:hypothetical protein